MTHHDAPVLPGGHGSQREEVLLSHMAGADGELQHEAGLLQEMLGRAGDSAVKGVHASTMASGAQDCPGAFLNPRLAACSAR